jgi:hypothetical protein
MNARVALTVAAVLGLCVTWVAHADAATKGAKKAAVRGQVTLVGCPQRGVPLFCTVMQGPAGTYVLNAANPPVPIGDKVLVVRGMPTTDLSVCFGNVLQNITWRATKRLCPK